MAASTNDKVTQASSGSRPVPTTLSAQKGIGAASISCGALTGWATATKVHFMIYNIDTSGAKVAGSQTDWSGIVSGTSITTLVLKAGTDAVYGIGAVVEAGPTAAWADDLYTAITKDHDSQGRHVQLTDTNNVKVVGLTPVASAVNNILMGNSITGVAPTQTVEGSDTNIDQKLTGKGTGRVYADGMPPQMFADFLYDFVESGLVVTADSVGVNKNYSISSGVVWIGGKRLTVAAVSAQTVGASKDRYIDLRDAGNGTATYQNNEVANNAASQALTAGDFRLAIVVAGATTIATTGSLNQGEPDRVLPIASSIAYSTTDSLGNLIGNRNPNPTLIGYRQIVTDFTSTATSTDTDITGLSIPVIVPTGRKIEVTLWSQRTLTSAAANNVGTKLFEGATQISEADTSVGSNINNQTYCSAILSPSAGLHTYKGSINQGINAGTMRFGGAAGNPGYIMVKLV